MYRNYIPIDCYIRAGKKIRKFVYSVLHKKEQIDDSVDRAEEKAKKLVEEAEAAAFNILENAEKRANRILVSGMFRTIFTGMVLISTVFFAALCYHWFTH